MTEIDWLIKHEDCNKSPGYSLTEIRSKCEVINLGDNGYLALLPDSDDESFKLTFGVFTFNNSDGKDEYVTVQFHGYGFTLVLRECRHTYWGEAGYLFYPDGKVISLAFKELAKYFDDME